MDMFTIVIIVVVLALLAIVAVLLMSNKSGETQPAAAEAPAGEEKKENPTAKRFKQVLSGNDLQSEMKKEEQELLTKYTAGTGEGIAEVEKLLVSDPNNVDLLDWLAFMYYSN
ncbi:MAG TPA: hypothetical protein PKO06_21135, partial [Candidatus Ozemobacteraceae bacterium]|nr:hypothetical protein [Candidatus Ozemobacteraceae bacterium]